MALAVAGLGAANVLVPHLPAVGTAVQVAGLALVSFPLATLAVYAAVPLAGTGSRLLGAGAAAAALTAVLIASGLGGTPATLTKLVAAACVGMALAALLQSAVEVVAIAVLIAAVDAYSVAAGPTKVIVEHHGAVLNAFTLGFHPIGSAGVAQIGASDFVFFALFATTAARLALRPRLTWLTMTASFGATSTLSYALDRPLPALPLLSLGFLVANADLLAERVRGRHGSPERE